MTSFAATLTWDRSWRKTCLFHYAFLPTQIRGERRIHKNISKACIINSTSWKTNQNKQTMQKPMHKRRKQDTPITSSKGKIEIRSSLFMLFFPTSMIGWDWAVFWWILLRSLFSHEIDALFKNPWRTENPHTAYQKEMNTNSNHWKSNNHKATSQRINTQIANPKQKRHWHP